MRCLVWELGPPKCAPVPCKGSSQTPPQCSSSSWDTSAPPGPAPAPAAFSPGCCAQLWHGLLREPLRLPWEKRVTGLSHPDPISLLPVALLTPARASNLFLCASLCFCVSSLIYSYRNTSYCRTGTLPFHTVVSPVLATECLVHSG